MPTGIKLVLVVLALACFVLATCKIVPERLIPAGLACLTGSLLVS